MTDFSDHITLGDGELNAEGEYGYAEKVTGSRVVRHSPHGWVDEWRRQDAHYTVLEIPAGHLFCHCCGDVRPKEYFQRDETRKARGGYRYWCKECEQPGDAERKRRQYAEMKAERGEHVRSYKRTG